MQTTGSFSSQAAARLRGVAAALALAVLSGCVSPVPATFPQASSACPVHSYPVCEARLATRAEPANLESCRCTV